MIMDALERLCFISSVFHVGWNGEDDNDAQFRVCKKKKIAIWRVKGYTLPLFAPGRQMNKVTEVIGTRKEAHD